MSKFTGFFGGVPNYMDTISGRRRVTVFGLPDSSHSLVPTLAAKGPNLIRRSSKFICSNPYVESGIIDNSTGEILCDQYSFRDVGDFSFPRSKDELRAMRQRLDDLAVDSDILVGLLGDDAANFPLIVGRGGVMIHIDAHDDRSSAIETLTHGNFLDKIMLHSPKLQVIQFGLREILDVRRTNSRQHTIVSTQTIGEMKETLARSEIKSPCWICLDTDVLPVNTIDSVACPMPGGLEAKLVENIVSIAVCSGLEIAGITVSELSPRRWPATRKDTLDAFYVTRLLVRMIDVSCRPREIRTTE